MVILSDVFVGARGESERVLIDAEDGAVLLCIDDWNGSHDLSIEVEAAEWLQTLLAIAIDKARDQRKGPCLPRKQYDIARVTVSS